MLAGSINNTESTTKQHVTPWLSHWCRIHNLAYPTSPAHIKKSSARNLHKFEYCHGSQFKDVQRQSKCELYFKMRDIKGYKDCKRFRQLTNIEVGYWVRLSGNWVKRWVSRLACMVLTDVSVITYLSLVKETRKSSPSKDGRFLDVSIICLAAVSVTRSPLRNYRGWSHRQS